jgi:Ca-activated chloride channel family protein
MIRSSGMPRLPIDSFRRRLYHADAAILCVISVVLATICGIDAFQQPLAQFSTGVQLVEVYATVTDANGGLVTGLGREDFEVQEDGEAQEISAFAAGEFPLTVVLGIDRSWSMAGDPLRLAKAASQTFLRQLRPSDRSMTVAIGSDAEIIAPLSNDHAQQQRAIDALDPWSTTSLHDAIISILDQVEGEPGRLAVVVFSDGVDRYSAAPASRVVERARQTQALIYPITIGRDRPPLAAELAVVSGGRSFLIRDARALEETFTTIARELRYQYLLGYTPMRPGHSGVREWRSIRVRVKGRTDFRVRARDGYTAG